MLQYLRYDVSAYELCKDIPKGIRKWTIEEGQLELVRRIQYEKQQKELHVDYYRIGYTVAFKLPVVYRAEEVPDLNDEDVWKIWLTWRLKERWALLNHAWRCLKDTEAGTMLQQELAALADWHDFKEAFGPVHLCTGHIAACLAQYLRNKENWEDRWYQQAEMAAHRLIHQDAYPWYEQTWSNVQEMSVKHVHNIPCIVLLGCADLAAVMGDPKAEEWNAKARLMMKAWQRFAVGETSYSEGTAYDAYFLEALTEWIFNQPDQTQMIEELQQSFAYVFQRWLRHTLPGRLDLHVPLGDVEAEMTFWMTVSMRFAAWYRWKEGAWLIHRLPIVRVPAAVLTETGGLAFIADMPETPPQAGIVADAVALTMRTGWDSEDCLAAVSLGCQENGHFHLDSGHLVIGHDNRFWITDPGYQQYREDREREYTLGIQAHNVPIIAGRGQTKRAPRLLEWNDQDQLQYAKVELTRCYEGLPVDSIHREIWMKGKTGHHIVVKDTFAFAQDELQVDYCWLGGAYLAWSFKQGWARLSDGYRALWIGASPGEIRHMDLVRHEGTRGPLTLRQHTLLRSDQHTIWWHFYFDTVDRAVPPFGAMDR